MRVDFGPWTPDAEDLNTGLSSDVSCVIPGPNCYYPFPSETVVTAALPGDCLGAISGITAAGDFFCFAGTATALYQLDTTDYTWTDVTRTSGGAYSASATEPWRFELWEYNGVYQIIACTVSVAPQALTIGSSSNFAALANAPQARIPRVWGSQLVLLSISDRPNAVQGSDINDPTTWTPSSTNNAFYQEFPTGGRIVGATNSTTPLIIQERAIRRGSIVGLPNKIVFDVVAEDIRCRFPESVTPREERIFWLADDGFYGMSALDPGPVPIGYQQVDRFVLGRADVSEGDRVVGYADPAARRVYWAFSTGGSATLTSMVMYDWSLQRWSKCTVNVKDLFAFQTPGIQLDAIDALFPGGLDALPFSLDSRILKPGAATLGFVGADNRLGSFTGAPKAAYATTAEFSGGLAARWRLNGALPVVDTNNVTVTPQRRDKRGDAWQSRAASSPNSTGWCPLRSTGRFHRLRVDAPAGGVWDKLQGVDVDMQPEGGR